MGYVKLGNADPTSVQSKSFDLKEANYKWIKIIIDGTLSSGTDGPGGLFDYTLTRFDKPVQRVPAKWSFRYGQIKRGNPTLNQASGGDHRIVYNIPMFDPRLRNTMHIMDKQEGDLHLSFGDFSSWSSATAYVVGVTDPTTPERYQLRLGKQNQELSGAGNVDFQVNSKNVTHLYLFDPDSVADKVTVDESPNADKEAITRFQSIPYQQLSEETDERNRVESGSNPITELPMYDIPSLQAAMNDRVNVDASLTGAGTLEVVWMSLTTDPELTRAQQSKDVVARRIREKGGGGGRTAPPANASAV